MLEDIFEKTYKLIMEDAYVDDSIPMTEEEIKQAFIEKYNLVLNPSTGRYDCDGNIEQLTWKTMKKGYDFHPHNDIPVPLGVIKGNFTNVHYYDSDWGWGHGVSSYSSCTLTSTKNFPTRVEGDMVIYAHGMKNTTLEGMPEFVGGDFIYDNNRNLESMVGAPKTVGGNFVCSHCYQLTDCTGAPQEIGEGVDLTWNYRLLSLKGLPKVINGDLNCEKCRSLSTLDDAPEKVTGKITLAGNISKADMNAYKLRVSGKTKIRELEKVPGMHRSEGIAAPRRVNVLSHDDTYKRFSSQNVPKGQHFWHEKIRGESKNIRSRRRVVK